jgi:hypothetical protein
VAIIVDDTGGIPDIDEGGYTARLVDMETTTSQFDNKEQEMFTYEVADPDFPEYDGITLKRWVNRKTDSEGNVIAHPKSTYYKDLCALNGVRDLSVGDSFDRDELIGRLVKIEVRIKAGQTGVERPKITEVRAMPRKAAVAATKTARRAPAAEDDDLPFD